MVVKKRMKNELGVKVRKALVASSAYGVRGYGAFYYGAGANTHGIYQVRTRFGKHVQVKEKFYFPKNPQLPDQQNWRGIFADAVAGWQGLTNEQQAIYNKKAKYKNLSGYNLYISEYLLSN